MIYSLSLENYKESLEAIVKGLSGKTFNIWVETENKRLKFCNRELGGKIFAKDGQVSLALKPGGSIAWDINSEEVKLEFGPNGDILLFRTFKTGRKKTMLITRSPI